MPLTLSDRHGAESYAAAHLDPRDNPGQFRFGPKGESAVTGAAFGGQGPLAGQLHKFGALSWHHALANAIVFDAWNNGYLAHIGPPGEKVPFETFREITDAAARQMGWLDPPGIPGTRQPGTPGYAYHTDLFTMRQYQRWNGGQLLPLRQPAPGDGKLFTGPIESGYGPRGAVIEMVPMPLPAEVQALLTDAKLHTIDGGPFEAMLTVNTWTRTAWLGGIGPAIRVDVDSVWNAVWTVLSAVLSGGISGAIQGAAVGGAYGAIAGFVIGVFVGAYQGYKDQVAKQVQWSAQARAALLAAEGYADIEIRQLPLWPDGADTRVLSGLDNQALADKLAYEARQKALGEFNRRRGQGGGNAPPAPPSPIIPAAPLVQSPARGIPANYLLLGGGAVALLFLAAALVAASK